MLTKFNLFERLGIAQDKMANFLATVQSGCVRIAENFVMTIQVSDRHAVPHGCPCERCDDNDVLSSNEHANVRSDDRHRE